jgi:metal-responsive CopG/Arc/MetJ family transcriptional regulator
MAFTKLTAFRFSDEDLALLDAIQKYMGIRSRSDALRAAIRSYVRTEAIPVPRRKPAKPKP